MSTPWLRAEKILKAARSMSGVEITLAELAARVNRHPGNGFSRDLALARHMALDDGERITECYYSKEQKRVVCIHLYAKQEQGKGVWGLFPHGSDVATRASNLRRHAEWEAANAEAADDRLIAQVAAHMGRATEEYGQAFRLMMAELKKHRGGNA